MNKEEINSTQYIENIIRDKNIKELIFTQKYRLTNSIKMGFKTIFFGKKWIIYFVLAFINLLVIILLEGSNAEYKYPARSFVNMVFDWLFPFMFIFGCLILSLPLSVDEISDHTIDYYLVRPIKREIYWLSRWIVINIVVFCVNVIIYFIYFLYFHAYASDGSFSGLDSNLHIFGFIVILLIPATLIYSGLFLLVGMIGNRGLLLGLMLAIFEVFFVSLFVLSDNLYIPQTNLYKIAEELFIEYEYIEFEPPNDLELLNAWLYSIIFSITVFIGGAFYLRIREIK